MSMNQLITVVNEIHDAFSNVKMNIKLNLPQIAVVGSQSSGKSSVLESIVGKDFLPRGSGIVTRCPLVLQLVQLHSSEEGEWGEFLHKPGKKYFNFLEINDEIQNRTVELAGASSITDSPINLKVFSRNVLNLTLVDLPGLVMNAVGDQPKDIDRQIKEMVTRYVAPENTIILAISPANADLATSASLRLAKQLDPEGRRTVGVLTKLDLMDHGTDAYDILTGKVIKLFHGFIGVVNRSQLDINNSKGMHAAREDERSFFHQHPAYSTIADTQGTEYLAKKLNCLLLDHIKDVIPDVKAHMDTLMESTRKQMEKLGMLEQTNIDSGAHVLSLLKKFSDSLNHTIDGGAADATKELMGGARLDYIFHECFASYVNGLTAGKDLTDEYIRINSRNMAGMHANLFPSDHVFVALSKQQVGRLEEPSLKCVQFVFEELIKIVDICASKVDGFPKLRQAIIDICRKSLTEYREPTLSHVRTIIAAERGFINVKHPMMEKFAQGSFLKIFGAKPDAQQENQSKQGGADEGSKGKGGPSKTGTGHAGKVKMGDVPTTIMLSNGMSEHEKNINDAIRDMVEGYFGIVKGSVADQVPKAITLLMISRLQEEVYAKLVRNLYRDNNLDELLAQSPEVETQRKAAKTMMAALQKAQRALENINARTMMARMLIGGTECTQVPVLEWALKEAGACMRGESHSSDTLAMTLSAYVRLGPNDAAARTDALWKRFTTVCDNDEVSRCILRALCWAEDSDYVERIVRKCIYNEGIRAQYVGVLFTAMVSNPLLPKGYVWSLFQKHFKGIERQWGSGTFWIATIVENVGSCLSGEAQAEEFLEFFQTNPLSHAYLAIHRAAENIRLRSWLQAKWGVGPKLNFLFFPR